MNTFNEVQYQAVLEPFKRANIYYPATLKQFLAITKTELDPDETVLETYETITTTLLLFNAATYPKECTIIKDQVGVIDSRLTKVLQVNVWSSDDIL